MRKRYRTLTKDMEHAILNMWAGGVLTGREIAEVISEQFPVDVYQSDVNNLIDRARKRGDKRAKVRKKYAAFVRST